MQSQIKDIDRLADIAEFSLKIAEQIPLFDKTSFFENELQRWGLVKWLENIGEAAYKVSVETKEEFSDVDWKPMANARHIYVHDYFRIDWELVWKLLQNINFEMLAIRAVEIKTILSERYSLS